MTVQKPAPQAIKSPLDIDKKTHERALGAQQLAKRALAFKDMPASAICEAVSRAALEDDLNTLKAIAVYHPYCASAATQVIVDDKTVLSSPAVVTAAGEGNVKVLRWLLDHGANIDARCVWGEETALARAVRRGQTHAVAMLIAAGANVNDTISHFDEQRDILSFADWQSDIYKMLKHARDNWHELRGTRTLRMKTPPFQKQPAPVVQAPRLSIRKPQP